MLNPCAQIIIGIGLMLKDKKPCKDYTKNAIKKMCYEAHDKIHQITVKLKFKKLIRNVLALEMLRTAQIRIKMTKIRIGFMIRT